MSPPESHDGFDADGYGGGDETAATDDFFEKNFGNDDLDLPWAKPGGVATAAPRMETVAQWEKVPRDRKRVDLDRLLTKIGGFIAFVLALLLFASYMGQRQDYGNEQDRRIHERNMATDRLEAIVDREIAEIEAETEKSVAETSADAVADEVLEDLLAATPVSIVVEEPSATPAPTPTPLTCAPEDSTCRFIHDTVGDTNPAPTTTPIPEEAPNG